MKDAVKGLQGSVVLVRRLEGVGLYAILMQGKANERKRKAARLITGHRKATRVGIQ